MKKRQMTLRGCLFVPLMTVFYELLVHCWTMTAFHPVTVATVAGFGLAFGCLLGLIASILPGEAQKWTAVAVSVLLAVVYLMEYFLNDAYQVFMTPTTIFDGADGVAEDYSELIVSLLLRDFWRIALALLPTVLYGIFARCGRARWFIPPALAVCALVFGGVSFAASGEGLTTAFNFDHAVRSFGLAPALTAEAFHEAEPEGDEGFIIIESQPPTEPAPTEAPAQPEETVEPTEPPVVYGDNVLPIDFAALAESEDKTAIASVHSYVAGLTPSKKNEYTGLFAGKNLIFITAEAFAAEAIDPDLTPTLYRLANEGIQFTDYYQPMWGGSTSTGEFSNLTGLVAADGSASMKEAAQQDMFLTIGNQLRKLEYTSYAFHNHSYSYYDRHLTHEAIGYDEYIGMGNGMEAGVKKQWPQSDLEMMEYTVPMYIDRQPFSIYYMSVSGHCLYGQGSNAMSRKNYDAVEHLACSETVKCYFAAQLELEYGLKYLVEQLEAAGIADDTVIVIGTDHYPYGLEKSSTWNNKEDYLKELYGYAYTNVMERDHSALIIWSGCLEDMDITVETPVYSLDILPTLSNLFGVRYDSRLLVGRDVFSDQIPLALWPDYSWKTEKGFYNGSTGVFTPEAGVEVEDGYAEYISSLVKNKITFSRSVQERDYYDYLVDLLPVAVG